MNVKFSDFEIVPVMSSVCKRDISDELYFSSKYARYISNSRLKNINPNEEGTPSKYLNPPRVQTTSLSIGSAVHECLLQPEEFELAPKLNKPTAKLGAVIDEIFINREKGLSIYNSIHKACEKVGYYVNSIDKMIPFIIKKGFEYYWNRRKYESTKEPVFLSNSDYDVVNACLNSCKNNKSIMKKLHPTDDFGDLIESHNEDALFIDFIVTYKKKHCVTLPFKLKADNWTIDYDNKVITLNDLKTTGKPVNWFMNPEYGSMNKYHYYRQMGIYSAVLWYYCQQNFGVCKNTGWTLKANMLVVETLPPYEAKCFYVSKGQLKQGISEFNELMKRVAYYEMFGYESEVNFI